MVADIKWPAARNYLEAAPDLITIDRRSLIQDVYDHEFYLDAQLFIRLSEECG